MIQYGFIPEFISLSRLPVICAIHLLSRDDLIRVLTEPRNALIRQFQQYFLVDGIELEFADGALSSIADKALDRATGARGPSSILLSGQP